MVALTILIFFVVFWTFVTVFGHLTWMLIEFLILGPKSERISTPQPKPSPKSDLLAADRVLSRLLVAGLLDTESVSNVRSKIGELANHRVAASAPYQTTSSQSASRFTQTEKSSEWNAGSAKPEHPVPPRANENVDLPQVAIPLAADTPVAPQDISIGDNIPTATPVVAQQIAEPPIPVSSKPPTSPHRPATPQHPAVPQRAATPEPAISKSEIIRSFLAAHNIRWGELVAGIMIVVCSIGLVLSLWETIVKTHRVVPSLIFLAANSAIFGAGLYTLRRWKLRHTSRAMLVIATLLVPPAILAGLATGGTTAATVFLNDPITLLGIALVGGIYATWLWFAGKALVGLRDAMPFMIGVAGPAAILPFVPAVNRQFDHPTILIISTGSLMVLIALTWLVRSAGIGKSTSLGVASGKHRLLIMGVGAFSLAALVGNVIHLIGPIPNRALTIAVSLIPAICALGTTASTMSRWDKRPKLGFAAASVALFATFCVSAILFPSLVSPGWTWAWALATSISIAVIAIMIRHVRALPMAILPIGVSAILTSSTWTDAIAWNELWLWQRCVGGQPMLASLVVASVAGILAWVSPKETRKNLLMITGGFFAFGSINAMVLSIAPASWLGIVPQSVVTMMLGLASLAVALGSKFLGSKYFDKTSLDRSDENWDGNAKHVLSVATIPLVIMTWCSVLHPVVIGMPIAGATVWLMTALAVATTMLVLTEAIKPDLSSLAHQAWRATIRISCLVSCFFAAWLVPDDWVSATYGFLCVAFVMLLDGLGSRKFSSILSSQTASLAAVGIVAWAEYFDVLFLDASWKDSTAIWGWAIVLAGFVVAWLLIREICRGASRVSVLHSQTAWLEKKENGPLRSLESLALSGTIVSLTVAAGYGFFALMVETSGETWLRFHTPTFYPVCGFAAASVMLAASWRHLGKAQLPLVAMLGVPAIVWCGNQLGVRMLTIPQQQLVLSTTTIAFGCGVLAWSFRDRFAQTIARFGAAIPVGAASSVLLSFGWMKPILRAEIPDAFATVTVSLWLGCGAIAYAMVGRKLRNTRLFARSAVLAAVTTFLLVPLVQPFEYAQWIQWSSIALFAWAAIVAVWTRIDGDSEFTESLPAIRGAYGVAMAGGLCTAIATTVLVFAGSQQRDVLAGGAGMTLVCVTAAAFYWFHRRGLLSENRLTWPIVVTAVSGHIAILASWGDPSSIDSTLTLMVIWTIAMVWSLVMSFVSSATRRLHIAHAGVMSVVIIIVSAIRYSESTYLWTGLVASCVGGLLTIPVAWRRPGENLLDSAAAVVASRLLNWFAVALGCFFIFELTDLKGIQWGDLSIVLIWLASWILIWRMAGPDVRNKDDQPFLPLAPRVFADTEIAFLVAAMWAGELLAGIAEFETRGMIAAWHSPWFIGRMVVSLLVVFSVIWRGNRMSAWFSSTAILLLMFSVLGLRIAADQTLSTTNAIAIATLVSSAVIAMLAFSFGMLSNGARKLSIGYANSLIPWTGREFSASGKHTCSMIPAARGVSLGMALMSVGTIVGCCSVLILENTHRILPLMIGGVAILAVATAELSSVGTKVERSIRRQLAVVLGLIATFMWASVGVAGTNYPALTLTMRWFVAAVISIGMFAFVLPKLLGPTQTQTWQKAFTSARNATGTLGIAMLVLVLVQEAGIHLHGDTELIQKPLVIGVGATLAILSLLTTLAAIFSAPGGQYQKVWQLSDRTRRILVVLAQVFGGLTWFHLFLCRNPLATLGLRAYWPYIVMVLAFVSVGITQWANRRGDKLMEATMRQTSLYLPLIPVLGFWLSLSIFEVGTGDDTRTYWEYISGKVNYQTLLLIGAVYYAGLSLMWKHAIPRVATVILGNATLWVILAQNPSWRFLSHPQAWLIPPAVSALIVAHLQRERLGKSAASAIRYAATLVIYISSTSDMLLNEVGSSIWGPIILVSLALIGMMVGVVLRVKPFLYLGAIFVFVGVASMVWHAQVKIDEVWPWWAFGISTGLLILGGLMAIEKNKPKLQAMANSLATWEG